MQAKEVPTTMGRFENTVVDTINAAKEYLSEGLEVVKDKIIAPLTSSIGERSGEKLDHWETADLRTEEERFKAGLIKVSADSD